MYASSLKKPDYLNLKSKLSFKLILKLTYHIDFPSFIIFIILFIIVILLMVF